MTMCDGIKNSVFLRENVFAGIKDDKRHFTDMTRYVKYKLFVPVRSVPV